MALLTLDHASLAFGHYALLDNVNFSLEPREVVGLIGRNGAGKSSLLKVIAGEQTLDDGIISKNNTINLAYVTQEPLFSAEDTVFDTVASGLGKLKSLLKEYHQLTGQLEHAKSDHTHLLERLQVIQTLLEQQDGWQFDSLIAATLSRLELIPDTKISELSGGWKKRVALARALVARPDVLLLDEPTNHLDIHAIEWLEGLLKNFNGSILLITHDRRFLDNVVTRIIELDRGQLNSYPGNFSAYQTYKTEQLAVEEEQNRLFDKFHAQEEVWIRKGIEARRTRNMGRVRRLEALRRERAARRERVGQVNFQLNAGERSGKLVAELEHVNKSFDERILISDFTTRILRGDKIGLIGPNGAGKTTLLKLVLGQIEADSGTIRRGTKQEIAYFDQFREQLDEDMSVADSISQGNEFITIGGQQKHVMSYLEDFLFSPVRARSPVRSLSGGERNRLLLARLFTKTANILVLDEPTNDLDIDTLELLEELLTSYSGTVFLVSHDRTFLDNVVTQVIVFEGKGKLSEYPGGYQDWQDALTQMASLNNQAGKLSVAPTINYTVNSDKPSKQRTKLSYKEQRELEQLPNEIAALEAEQATLNKKLLDPNAFRDHPQEAATWQPRIETIEEQLLEKLARWEELESKPL